MDFHDIVDRDKFYYEQHSSQLFVGSLIESLPLRIGILVAIILNSIVVGLQTNKRLVSCTLPCSLNCDTSGFVSGCAVWSHFLGSGQILPDSFCY